MLPHFFKQAQWADTSQIAAIAAAYCADETTCVKQLLGRLDISNEQHAAIARLARELVQQLREQEAQQGGIEAVMRQYDLSTEQGVTLLCVAEALLRIPDQATQDAFIQDKLSQAHWEEPLGAGASAFVQGVTRALALSRKILKQDDDSAQPQPLKKTWKYWLKISSIPVIRRALRMAMQRLSAHFILGRSIPIAMRRAQPLLKKGYVFSYDCLGEAACTQSDAEAYFNAYQSAIRALGAAAQRSSSTATTGPSAALSSLASGVSVKLSALYPRYEPLQQEDAVLFLTERLKHLCLESKEQGIDLTLDAEEVDRFFIYLKIVHNLLEDPALQGWKGLGVVVQAYQKSAYATIEYLIDKARSCDRVLQVRLVKGAYWDTEIKKSQVGGFSHYPVFTRKHSTDVSYLACAQLLMSAQDVIYPQFATHNAQTIAALLTLFIDPARHRFEFQKLQGMGSALHDELLKRQMSCRIYAPVGGDRDLLPYLARRLLENGANTSFVNQTAHPQFVMEDAIADPILETKKLNHIPHPNIVLPKALYGKKRLNSVGLDLSNPETLVQLEKGVLRANSQSPWSAQPSGAVAPVATAEQRAIVNPADHRDTVGYCVNPTQADIEIALTRSADAFGHWNAQGPQARSAVLLDVAHCLEQHRSELVAMTIREAGKTVPDALSEVREAVDFCRYYTAQACELMKPQPLTGPTGESNCLSLQGRGPTLCISPWNFPIAIFMGQIAAALVTGNTVLAKPASQTPLIAARMVQCCHQAGVPEAVLQLLPGESSQVGQPLLEDERVAAVVFTGSIKTAKQIQQTLVARSGPIVPLIAETGGINAMMVDSSALLEQVVHDVLISAFSSAGQRCSALRLLCVQEEVADPLFALLKGAMALLKVGDPMCLATDLGPVIDETAKARLEAHMTAMEAGTAQLIARSPLDPKWAEQGTFVAPAAYKLRAIEDLSEEFFGPILHVFSYPKSQLTTVIDAINAKGYGLTFGVHSRVQSSIDSIQQRVNAGNIYVNRHMIGAVVGVQPFGGQGLSGTGPKAGGPHYLARLCSEQTVTVDTTAMGGNLSLLAS